MSMPMRIVITTIFLLTTYWTSSSQNLVRNPSYEEYHMCPSSEGPLGSLNNHVKDWNSVSNSTGTPGYTDGPGEYFREDCFKYFDYDSLYYYVMKDSILPHSGQAMLQVLLTNDYRKKMNVRNNYVYTKLHVPLEKDSTYRVSYHVHFNRFYQIQDHVGITFIRDTTEIYSQGPQYLTDDYVGVRDSFLGPDLLWHKIEGCYTAKGGEEWLLLGEFIPNEDIHMHPWEPLWGLNGKGAYALMVDDVYVGKATSQQEKDHYLTACDGEKTILPSPDKPTTVIHDQEQQEVSYVHVKWPEKYSFTYHDACYGKLGSIEVQSEICIEKIDTTLTICDGEKIMLDDILAAPYTIRDKNGEILKEFSTLQPDTYTFTAFHETYKEWGTVTIQVVRCENCQVDMPTVIRTSSTNGNNLWSAYTNCSFESFDITIFDRWGSPIFSSTIPESRWDGSTHSSILKDDVYTYILRYKFHHPVIPQKEQWKTGTISVLK